MPRASSGDKGRTRCKYLEAWFWINPDNWYWASSTNKEFKDRMIKRMVVPAMKEMEKRAK